MNPEEVSKANRRDDLALCRLVDRDHARPGHHSPGTPGVASRRFMPAKDKAVDVVGRERTVQLIRGLGSVRIARHVRFKNHTPQVERHRGTQSRHDANARRRPGSYHAGKSSAGVAERSNATAVPCRHRASCCCITGLPPLIAATIFWAASSRSSAGMTFKPRTTTGSSCRARRWCLQGEPRAAP